MELDELKKSWNALNEQLQKEPIADEQQIISISAASFFLLSNTPCLWHITNIVDSEGF